MSVAHRAAWALVALLVLVTPLVILPGARDAFALPKLFAAEVLGLASLLVAALGWRGGGLALAVRRPAVLAAMPLVVAATASAAASSHSLHVRQALPHLLIGAACLVGWSLTFDRARLRRLLDILLVPAALLALLAALQFHGVFQPFRFSEGAHAARLQVTSLAGAAGDLGSYLVLPCLVAQDLLARGRRRRWAAAALALCLYGIAVSQTLAALLALAAGGLAYWAAAARGRRRLLVVSALLAAAALVAVVAVAPLRGRVVRKVEQAASGDWATLLTGRLDGWQAAVEMARRHPWLGVGPGAYRAEFAPIKLELSAAGREFFVGHRFPMFSHAHSEPLEVAAESGLAGVVALLWGLVVLARSARRIEGPDDRALAVGGLVALGVLALAYFPFRLALTGYPAIAFLAWILRDELEAAA